MEHQSAAQMRNASTTKAPTVVSASKDTKATEKHAPMTTSVLEILVTPKQCAETQTVRSPVAVNVVI